LQYFIGETHMPSAIAVFSGKSKERIFRDGGTQSWRLVPSHAAKQEFVVVCRSGVDWAEGTEDRGSAFLVGRLAGVQPSDEEVGRYLIKMTEYADVSVPGAWKGWRNPVKYSTLEELGIDPSSLTFKPLPPPSDMGSVDIPRKPKSPVDPLSLSLSISEAKAALSRHYQVPVDAIEITIRG
jgi:hypothetical protein